MQCSKCGYQMHGKETVCICCGQIHSSYSEPLFPPVAAQRSCESCGRVQSVSSQRCPSCGINPSFRGYSLHANSSGVSQRDVTLVVAAVALAALILGLSAWGISAQNTERQAAVAAAQAQAAREVRLTAALTRLRAARPAAFFERYPGDNNSIAFQAQLTTCDVRGMTFSRTDDSDTLTVNVSLLGYKAEHQAPLVNVALYGEDGTLLSEKAIVEFASAELEQGETREVEDTMDYPKNGVPVFVGVNEGNADVAPASTAPQPPVSSATDASSASGESYQEAIEDFKYACSQQGYTVIWPHDGDEDVVGVLVDDGAQDAWSAADKNALSKTLAENFEQSRLRGGRTGPYKAIVRFVPSGYVVTVTPNFSG